MNETATARSFVRVRATELLWYAFAVFFVLTVFAWARIEIGVFLAPVSLFILVGVAYLRLIGSFAAGFAPAGMRGMRGYYAVLFLLALTAVVANLVNTVDHLEILIQFLIFIGAALIIPVFLHEERIQKNILYIVILAITAIGAYGAYGVLVGDDRWLEVGTIGSRNVNAFLFQIAAVAALGLFIFSESRLAVRLIFLAAFFANTAFVVLTLSRGGMVGVAFAVLYFARHRKRVMIAVVGLMIAAAAFLMPEKYMARHLSIFNLEDRYIEYDGGEFGNTIPGRLSIQKFYSEILVKKPVFGHGFGYIRDRIRTNTNLFPYRTHSSYLGIAVEAGLVGSFVFIALFAVMFLKIRSVKRQAAWEGRAVPMVDIGSAMLITAALNCLYMDLYSWIYFWQMVGLVAAFVGTAAATSPATLPDHES